MKIFLIRHGESMQNTGDNFTTLLPDHKVYLTEKGKEQAAKAGKFLAEYVKENKIDLNKSTLWVSPYERTRQTAKIINEQLKISDVKEDIALIEQQYGLFEMIPSSDWAKVYPNESKLFYNYVKNGGKFFAKFPQGESPFDVSMRIRIFLQTLFRDLQEGKENFFIVSHGTNIRAFLMAYFHYSPEWYNEEPLMQNCAVRLIERKDGVSTNLGYIFKGPTDFKTF